MKYHNRKVARSRRAQKPRYRSKRKLIGTWTVERATDLRAMHGCDLEKELTRVLTEAFGGNPWQK
jgi:hypothetical protein